MQEGQDLKCSLEVYTSKVEPKLKEIDIFLKCNDIHSIEETAKVLDLTEDEVSSLTKYLGIKKINNKNFMLLMQYGSSLICNLLKKELECGSPYFYTAWQISYIYSLDYIKVKDAFDFLSLDKVTSRQIKAILAQIT